MDHNSGGYCPTPTHGRDKTAKGLSATPAAKEVKSWRIVKEETSYMKVAAHFAIQRRIRRPRRSSMTVKESMLVKLEEAFMKGSKNTFMMLKEDRRPPT